MIAPPPPVICSARVLAYAIMPDEIPFTDRATVFIDGERLDRVPCVAIAEGLQSSTSELLLLYCDEQWGVIAVGGGDLVSLRRRMELNYPGVSKLWVDVNTPVDVALKYHDEHIDSWRCPVCRKRAFDVDTMYGNEDVEIAVCGECADGTAEGAAIKARCGSDLN
jgi:hypothetical protein